MTPTGSPLQPTPESLERARRWAGRRSHFDAWVEDVVPDLAAEFDAVQQPLREQAGYWKHQADRWQVIANEKAEACVVLRARVVELERIEKGLENNENRLEGVIDGLLDRNDTLRQEREAARLSCEDLETEVAALRLVMEHIADECEPRIADSDGSAYGDGREAGLSEAVAMIRAALAPPQAQPPSGGGG